MWRLVLLNLTVLSFSNAVNIGQSIRRVIAAGLLTLSSPVCMNSWGLSAAETSTINVFEKSTPSVVFINTFVEQLDAYSMNVMEVKAGQGSGFIWDKAGHVVTNYHVICNAAKAEVSVVEQSGKVSNYVATVLGVDPDKDVAVLTIPAQGKSFRPIQIGRSSNLKVGQSVLAIGNPFGLDHTLTTGVISGLGREVRSPSNRPISNVIQTDASINPGNSGGPLLDSSGDLIGMNTAIFSLSGASAGIGFAIPVDTLKYEVDTLIRDGRVLKPVMGITYLDASQARPLGVENGVLVLYASVGSPARDAGIRGTSKNNDGGISLGDIIIGVDDCDINTEADLFKALEVHKVGDRISLTLLRRQSLVDQKLSSTIKLFLTLSEK
jgi:S1-C subfamily serine protease